MARSSYALPGTLVDESAKAEIAKAVSRVKRRVQGSCGPLSLGVGIGGVLCKYLSDCCRPEPPSPFRGVTIGQRSLAWASLDATPSLAAARHRGCTLNDLWMSALASAMGTYMRTRGIGTAGLDLTAGLPVSMHPPILAPEIGNTAGNRARPGLNLHACGVKAEGSPV